MKAAAPAQKDLTRIHALWDRLAAYPVTEIDAACRYLMSTAGEWLDAYNAAWIGTARLQHGRAAEQDALSGWRTKTLVFLRAPDEQEQLLARQVLAHHPPEPGMTGMAVARQAGKFRVHRLHGDGFVDWNAFRKTVHYEAFYRRLDVQDRLWIVTPMGADAESIFVFDKRGKNISASGENSRTRFRAGQVRLAADAIRGLSWFQRHLMYSYGLPLVDSPLTPMERRVVQLLLSDKSEKQIAAAMRQSTHTTHGHIKEIYRKYGVQGRPALMAIWLSKG